MSVSILAKDNKAVVEKMKKVMAAKEKALKEAK